MKDNLDFLEGKKPLKEQIREKMVRQLKIWEVSWQSIEKKWKWKIKLLQRRKPLKEHIRRRKKLDVNIVRGMDNKSEGIITLESQYISFK